MIHFVTGDILFSKAQVIASGVAANDPMSQGLALSLHNIFPDLHRAFHQWCHQKHPEPGKVWLWDAPNGKRIAQLITQEGGYGHGQRPGKAAVIHLRHALRALRKLVGKEKITSLALPRIATGVGGLRWEEVLPLIEEQFGELDIPVYVYSEYVPKQSAVEPGL